jgi:hypothetical protein
LKSADAFRERLHALGVTLGFEPSPSAGEASPLATAISATAGMAAGNRWCILPMEGWDGTLDGHPSDLTRRRWTHSARAARRSSGVEKQSPSATTAAPTRTS